MNKAKVIGSSLAVPGALAIVLGVTIISQNSSSIRAIYLGTGVLFLGLITTAWGIYTHRPLAASTRIRQQPSADANIDIAPKVQPKAVVDQPPAGGRTGPNMGDLSADFIRWFDQQDVDEKFWATFDRWIREALNKHLQARRIRCFRITDRGRRLFLLNEENNEDPLWSNVAQQGLIDHVTTSGQSYIRGNTNNGPMVEQLADKWTAISTGDQSEGPFFPKPEWLIPIRRKKRTVGLIMVGELPAEELSEVSSLEAFGDMLELFWNHVDLEFALAAAERTDQASGVLNRIDLSNKAEAALRESSADGEPTVVLALSVEGVRRLDDKGHWEERDWLMKQIGRSLRNKLRSDDLVGRFSDDRFVVILRRLDMSLGQLIAKKLLDTVENMVGDKPDIVESIRLRCGLVDGTGKGFEQLLEQIFGVLHQARLQDKRIITASAANTAGCAVNAGAES